MGEKNVKMRWIALLALVMLLLLGVGGASAEETTTAAIDLVFDGKMYTDTVQVEWTEKYPVPEGGVKWDGTEEFVEFDSYTSKDIREYNGALYVGGQIIFQAKNTSSFYEVEQIAAKFNARIIGYIARTENYAIELLNSDTATEEELLQIIGKLKKEPCIIASTVAPNIIIRTEELVYPNDPWSTIESRRPNWSTKLSELTTDQANWNAIAIQANKAWGYRDQMQPLTVGVIDTSFPTGHRDITFAGIVGNNYATHETHAMHVSGIIAAIHDNGKGISGIFPKGSILGIGIVGGILANDLVTDILLSTFFSHMCGIVKCINEGVEIINISQGTKELQYNTLQFVLGLFGSSIDYVCRPFFGELENQKKDFLLVCSAGNENGDTQKQQWYLDIKSDYLRDRLVIVGGIKWENGSPVFIKEFAWGEKVDILAPGYRVLSTTLTDFYAFGERVEGKEYYRFSGTSMAAPHVTGVAAMIKSINPDITGPEIKRILLRHGDQISDSRGHLHPILDAYACVRDVLGMGSIYGLVEVDSNGLEDAVVHISQNGTDVMSLITDKNGQFHADLPAGEYSLSLNQSGYEPIERYIVVSPGDDVNEIFSLQTEEVTKGKLNGMVTFNAQGVNDIKVNVLKGTTSVITLITANGYFDVDLEPGTYTLSIDADGYVPTSRDITVFTGKTTTENIELDDAMYAVATQTMNTSIQYDVKLFNANDSITQLDMKVTLRNGTVLMDTANGIRSGVTMRADGFAFQIDDELAQGAQLEVTAADGQRRTYSGAIVLSSGLWSGTKKLPDSRSNGGYWDANGFYHESKY